MNRNWKTFSTTLALGAAMTASPIAGACAPQQTPAEQEAQYQDWTRTDAAAGHINMHDVEQAFKSSPNIEAFERRINEIYEGDWLVLVRALLVDDTLVLEGWEDLDGDGLIDDGVDDPLFEISGSEQKGYRTAGRHLNSHYDGSLNPGTFLLTYALISAMNPATSQYATPESRIYPIHEQRRLYRHSPAYRPSREETTHTAAPTAGPDTSKSPAQGQAQPAAPTSQP